MTARHANTTSYLGVIAFIVLATSVGCHGDFRLTSDDGTGTSNGAANAAANATTQPTPEDRLELLDHSRSPGVRRLTSTEYRLSVEQLTGWEPPRERIPRELAVDGHSQIASAQKVGYSDVGRYLDLALQAGESAAAQAEADLACTDDACWHEWATDFIRMAFRNEPTTEQIAQFTGILDAPEAGATTRERAAVFAAAVLASPSFLYRREYGVEPVGDDDSIRQLDDYAIATRLSYLVWQRGPDRELLDAAAAGELKTAEGRIAAAERLLADPRAEQGLTAFVYDWMAIFNASSIGSKDASVLTGTGENFADSVRSSFDFTVTSVLFGSENAGFADLLAVDAFVVDADVAAVLGADAVDGGGFEPRTLPDHGGILTHPLVIAAHSKEQGPSPFPIGAFVYENVLCEEIPEPPPVPEVTIQDAMAEDATLRERLESMTSGENCIGCHARIGPAGFAFLSFDPIGRFTPDDPIGRPWQTAGEVPVGADILSFDGAVDLSRQLAEHPRTADCIARRLFRWTYGRYESADDSAELDALRRLSLDEQTAARSLILSVVASDAFGHVRLEISP